MCYRLLVTAVSVVWIFLNTAQTTTGSCTVNSYRLNTGFYIEKCNFLGAWGILCNPSWGVNEATVACRMGGWCPSGACAGVTSQIVQVAGRSSSVDNRNCTGGESEFALCTPVVTSSNCGSNVFRITCPKKALNATCSADDDCGAPNATCTNKQGFQDKICSCREQFYEKNGTCMAKKALNVTCSADYECGAPNATCANKGGFQGTVCACDSQLFDAAGFCRTKKALNVTCSADYECGAPNATCANKSGFQGTVCACDSRFYDEAGFCLTKKPLNSPCLRDEECESASPQCTATDAGKVCSNFSPCQSNSCLNNGTCVVTGSSSTCQCQNAFGGVRCEHVVSDILSSVTTFQAVSAALGCLCVLLTAIVIITLVLWQKAKTKIPVPNDNGGDLEGQVSRKGSKESNTTTNVGTERGRSNIQEIT